MHSIISALTELQTDRLIDMLADIVKFILSAMAALLPILLLYFQRRNSAAASKKMGEVEAKVDANTIISQEAFTVANGHNAKIAHTQEMMAEIAKAAVAAPKEVVVVNPPDKAIPTTDVGHSNG